MWWFSNEPQSAGILTRSYLYLEAETWRIQYLSSPLSWLHFSPIPPTVPFFSPPPFLSPPKNKSFQRNYVILATIDCSGFFPLSFLGFQWDLWLDPVKQKEKMLMDILRMDASSGYGVGMTHRPPPIIVIVWRTAEPTNKQTHHLVEMRECK